MVSLKTQTYQVSEEDEKTSFDSDQNSEISENTLEDIYEKEYADLTKICMTSHEEDTRTSSLHSQEVNTPSQKITRTPLFTLDDIPPTQWRKKTS